MSVTGFLQGVNPRLVFMIIFAGALALLMYRDRNSVQRQSILFYRRTKKGLKLIDSIAQRFPRFWNFYGWAGLVVGVISIPFILWNIVLSFSQMTQTGGASGGPSLIAPGLSGETTFQSGISFIPVEYWLIAIGVLMFVHEMSHGIVARAEGMELNSVGWIVLGIIPGAFVEPKGEQMLPGEDEEKDGENEEASLGGHWDQGTLSSRLKVLAAGSFANYITAAVMGVSALALFMTVAQPTGVFYQAQDGLPAAESGMNNGTLYSIGEQPVHYGSDVRKALENYEINDTVEVNTSEGMFNVTLMDRNSSAHMGVLIASGEGPVAAFFDMIYDRRTIKPEYKDIEGFLSWTLGGLEVIALLNLLIGLFNMLPIRPLDGGQMVGAVVDKYFEDSQTAFNYISLVVWIFLLGAMIFSIATGL
ncbi:site-2 protease family protein [Candidatus Nanosalina sp. VS9-1]|uniref:site-2 protease family protein n=1 Tax=Candidatus Nanosalina sp. VS9-1 TaxID=3388566 RepID=UPI0039DFA930